MAIGSDHRPPRRPTRPRRGFTLMETALATVIVGVGTLGIFSLIAACINQTRASADLTAGMNLAANVRELSLSLAFREPSSGTEWGLNTGESATSPATWDDINDLDGLTISPPITSARTRLTDMSAWAQRVTVRSVDPDRLSLIVPNGSARAVQVTTVVTRNGNPVSELSWFVFDGRNP